jgi:hypothetical protein
MENKEIDSVMILFNYYRQAAGIEDHEFDENKLLKTLREYNIRPNLFLNIATQGLRPVGVIGGFISEDPVQSEITATIQFNYLLDEFNSVENYAELIAVFQQWALQFTATQIRAIDIGNRVDRLCDVYEILGFDPIRVTIMNKEIT